MKLILIALAALVFVLPASAGKPQPDLLLATTSLDGASIVEGQSPTYCNPASGQTGDMTKCVVNPTDPFCMWDIDDRWTAYGDGTLQPGLLTVSQCVIADNAHRLLAIGGHSSSPDVIVRVTYEQQGVSFTFSPEQIEFQKNRERWRYHGCVMGPLYSTVSLLPEIEGSNGGHGVYTIVTFSVENSTGEALRDSRFILEMGSDSPSSRQDACKGERTPLFEAGGAVWETAL